MKHPYPPFLKKLLLIFCVIWAASAVVLVYLNQTSHLSTLRVHQISTAILAVGFGLLVLLGHIWFIQFQKHREQAMVQQEISYDRLTGLYNANGFEYEALKWLRDSAHEKTALMVLDIDNFKLVNDLFGYASGDAMLCFMAGRLSLFSSRRGLAARLNGDKFLMLMEYHTPEALEQELYGLLDEMTAGGTINEYNMRFAPTFSLGLVLLDKDNQQNPILSALIDQANISRKCVKNKRKNVVSFYDSHLRARMILEKEIEDCMAEALANREFVVYLQPQYDLDKNAIVGAEALVRWYHPEKGMMSPALFIPIFESNGFITLLDYYVFEEACSLLQRWQESGLPLLTISVNMSRLHMHNPDFPVQLSEICDRHKLSRELLVVELTESAFFEDRELMLDMMRQLKDYGFSLSIDDFGTGYSSLAMLMDMPANEVKLDRSFFCESLQARRGRMVVSSIINMAHKLDLSVIAEGIETEEQMILLRSIGCHLIQGYYFARPMSMESFDDFYRAHLPKRFEALAMDDSHG